MDHLEESSAILSLPEPVAAEADAAPAEAAADCDPLPAAPVVAEEGKDEDPPAGALAFAVDEAVPPGVSGPEVGVNGASPMGEMIFGESLPLPDAILPSRD